MASYHPMDVMPCAQLSIFTNVGEFVWISFLLNWVTSLWWKIWRTKRGVAVEEPVCWIQCSSSPLQYHHPSAPGALGWERRDFKVVTMLLLLPLAGFESMGETPQRPQFTYLCHSALSALQAALWESQAPLAVAGRCRQDLSSPLKAISPAAPVWKRKGQTKSILCGFSPGDPKNMRFKLKYHTISHVSITNKVFPSFLSQPAFSCRDKGQMLMNITGHKEDDSSECYFLPPRSSWFQRCLWQLDVLLLQRLCCWNLRFVSQERISLPLLTP